MTTYRIDEDGSAVSIEVTEVGGKAVQMLGAFGECQAGNCSCPTDEYQKLGSLDLQQTGDVISLRLEAKPGEKFDTCEIAACLDHATSLVDEKAAVPTRRRRRQPLSSFPSPGTG